MTDPRKILREAELALYLEANDFLGQTGCTSFIQLALINPELWAQLRQNPALRLHTLLFTTDGRSAKRMPRISRSGFTRQST